MIESLHLGDWAGIVVFLVFLFALVQANRWTGAAAENDGTNEAAEPEQAISDDVVSVEP